MVKPSEVCFVSFCFSQDKNCGSLGQQPKSSKEEDSQAYFLLHRATLTSGWSRVADKNISTLVTLLRITEADQIYY